MRPRPINLAILLVACASAGASGCGGAPVARSSAPPVARDTAIGDSVLHPEVRLRTLAVAEGPLAVEDARAALALMRPRVQACIDATSLRVEGSVDVRLDVSPTGQVARSGTDRVEGLDPDVVFCVVRALRGGRLPRASAASVVQIGLSFSDPRARAGADPSAEPPPTETGPAPNPPRSDLGDPGSNEEAPNDGAPNEKTPER